MDTRISSRTSVVVAVIAAVLAVWWAPAVTAAPPDGITEYPLPSGLLYPQKVPSGIAAGPDGNMWFTEYQGNAIGRITPDGTITEYPLPTAGSQPNGIAAGPDGNLWFTEYAGNQIGRITPAGTITEYPLPTADGLPNEIAAGPDGNLWFTESRREPDRADHPGRHHHRIPPSHLRDRHFPRQDRSGPGRQPLVHRNRPDDDTQDRADHPHRHHHRIPAAHRRQRPPRNRGRPGRQHVVHLGEGDLADHPDRRGH